jgi:protein TilB
VQDLRYLNVAMNRISRCENLQGCESLEKLDMTLNKVGMAELPSLAALRANSQLRRLYLLGNPCTTWSDHRRYVVATLPQLEHLVSQHCRSYKQLLPSCKPKLYITS